MLSQALHARLILGLTPPLKQLLQCSVLQAPVHLDCELQQSQLQFIPPSNLDRTGHTSAVHHSHRPDEAIARLCCPCRAAEDLKLWQRLLERRRYDVGEGTRPAGTG